MYKELETLCSIPGVSGREDKVRDCLITLIGGSAEYNIDPLGNLIVFKKGFPQDVTHILWKAFSTAPQLLHYLYSLSVCSRIFNKLYCTFIAVAVFCCIILSGIHIAIIFNDFSALSDYTFFVFIIWVDFPIVAVVICA